LHLGLLATVGLHISICMTLKSDSEIAPEAGIGRGRGESKWLVRKKVLQPFGKLSLALHIGFSKVLDDKLAGV